MSDTHSMSQDQFLLVAVNLLHKGLVDAGRTEAKQLYRKLSEGVVVPLSRVRMEDESTAAFMVSLDHSEFRGKINYGAFRASLSTLLSNFSQALQGEKAVPVFADQGDGQSMIFGVTAVTVEQDKPNVMVLSADPATRDGATELRLMYLDPGQFQDQVAETPDQAVT
ncbi:MAG: hypothetical protein ACI9NT_002325 [Bacteroidia bacterium]|jgi:hypothetical protein